MFDYKRWASGKLVFLFLVFAFSGSAFAAEMYQVWAEGRREEGIRMLKSQAAGSNQVAAYGYVRFSDIGTKELGRIALDFGAENWWAIREQGKFKDGSFYAYFSLQQSNAAEVTVKATSPGYQKVVKKFFAKSGNTYDLGEIVMQKLDPADFTAGVKGKVFLPFSFIHSGVKVYAAYEGYWSRNDPYVASSRDGSFEIKGLPPGEYYIVFRHPLLLFKHPGRSVTLRKGEILDLGSVR